MNKNCLQCANVTDFYSNCGQCPSGYYVSGFECIEEDKTFPGAAASKGTSAAAKVTTQAVSAVSSGSSAGASAAISGKVFSNIKFINISYSDDLENALTTWNSNYFTLGFNTDIPDKLERKFVNASLPEIFEKHQVNSCFLINFWEPLVMLLILVLFFVVVLGVDWMISQWMKKDKKSLQYRIITRVKVMVLNFLIVQLYGMYGDIVFYGMIEWRSTQVTAGINFLSSFAAIILLVAMILGFFLHVILLKRYQNVKRNFGAKAETKQHFDKFIADHEGIQVIFGDFKDQSLIHQSFILILTIRDILFSIILTTLFEHPLTECVLILLMNIVMLLYLVIKKPFREVFAQVQQIVLELITFIVNVSVLILAILDKRQLEAFDQRKTIGKLLIIINMVFNFSIVFFMLFSLGSQGWEIYQDYKQRHQLSKMKNLKIESCRDSKSDNNDTNQTMIIKTRLEDSNSKFKGEDLSLDAGNGTINTFRNDKNPVENSSSSVEILKVKPKKFKRPKIHKLDNPVEL